MATKNQIGLALSGSTGTGSFVGSISPTLVTPILGAATATTIVFNPTTGGIIGTTTNDNADAGNVGEFISSIVLSGSAVSLVSSTAKTVTSISLTAGDWDVQGEVFFTGGATTQFTQLSGAISITNNTLPTIPSTNGSFHGNRGTVDNASTTTRWIVGTNSVSSVSLSPNRQSLSATTTIYLIALATFTVSTASAYGKITARRIR